MRAEWLNGLIFATELCLKTTDPHRKTVIEQCLVHLDACPDLVYHACRFFAVNGEENRALELLSRAATTGYPHLTEPSNEPELEQLRASGALDAALGRQK